MKLCFVLLKVLLYRSVMLGDGFDGDEFCPAGGVIGLCVDIVLCL